MENSWEDEDVTHAILRVLEWVTKAQGGSGNKVTIVERLRSNGTESFKGISGTTSTATEYWLDSTKRILENLECTLEHKLNGTMSLLREEVYHWWHAVEKGTLAKRITWEYFWKLPRKSLWGRGMRKLANFNSLS